MGKRELHNLEAEMMILGCLLLDNGNDDVTDELMTELEVRDFAFTENQSIFAATKVLYNKGAVIDFVTVVETLERTNGMVNAGGISYISKVNSACFTKGNYKYYLSIVKDLSKLRAILSAGKQIADSAVSGRSATVVLGEAEKLITSISEEQVTSELEHIEEANKVEIERLRKVMDGHYDVFGIETGFRVLDRTLWGLQKSDMITVAARPGAGKTAFALNILKNAAIDNQKNCIFFSLEMPKAQIIQRLYSLISGIDNYTVKSGKGLGDYKEELNKAAQKIRESGLHIDDQSNITVSEMLAKARRFKRKQKLDLVVIDYLQFVKPTRVVGNRATEVGEIARDIKNLARQLNVPVVVLAQLNREKDKDSKLPVLADLRESGEIENNSDIVMFLHSRGSQDTPMRNIDLIIGKFRNGQMKNIAFTFAGSIFKFEELQKEKPRSEQTKIDRLIPVEEDLGF